MANKNLIWNFLNFLNFLILIFLFLSSRGQVIGLDMGSMYTKVTIAERKLQFVNLPSYDFNKNRSLTLFSLETLEIPRQFQQEVDIFSVNQTNLISYFLPLLGISFNEGVEYIGNFHLTFNYLKNKQERISIIDNNNNSYSIEEIVAMMLDHIKRQVNKFTELNIKDYALVVPPHFNITQKIALLDAAEIAEIKVVAMISENVASSIKYQYNGFVSNKFISVLYLNLGASSFKATIMEHFHMINNSNTQEHIKILAEIVDDQISGRMMDIKLANLIISKLNGNLQDEIRSNKEIYSRLINLAENAKRILSKKNIVIINLNKVVKSLEKNITITRDEFEESIHDILKSFADILENVIKLHQKFEIIQLIGATSSIPIFKQTVENFARGFNMKKDIDNCDSSSFGAAYIGANFTKSLDVRPIKLILKENELIKVKAEPFFCRKKYSSTEEFCKRSTQLIEMFTDTTPYGTNKTIQIPVTSDIELTVYIDDVPFYFYNITGIKILQNHPNLDKTQKLILKINMGLSQNGLPILYNATGLVPILVNHSVDSKKEASLQENSSKTEFKTVKKLIEKPLYINSSYVFPFKTLSTEEKNDAKARLKLMSQYESKYTKFTHIKNETMNLILETKKWMEKSINLEYLNKTESEQLRKLLKLASNLISNNNSIDQENVNNFSQYKNIINSTIQKYKARIEEYGKFDSYLEKCYRLIEMTENDIKMLKNQYNNYDRKTMKKYEKTLKYLRNKTHEWKEAHFKKEKFVEPIITMEKIRKFQNKFKEYFTKITEKETTPDYSKDNIRFNVNGKTEDAKILNSMPSEEKAYQAMNELNEKLKEIKGKAVNNSKTKNTDL